VLAALLEEENVIIEIVGVGVSECWVVDKQACALMHDCNDVCIII
jgi:hypothetical protein